MIGTKRVSQRRVGLSAVALAKEEAVAEADLDAWKRLQVPDSNRRDAQRRNAVASGISGDVVWATGGRLIC